jgi:hypothetical protein
MAPIKQSYALPGTVPDCAIGAFIGLHGQNVFTITRVGSVTGNFN